MQKIISSLLVSLSLLSAQSATDGESKAKELMQKIKIESPATFNGTRLPAKYKHLPALIEKTKQESPLVTITYLTSSSVPISSHVSYANSAAKLIQDFNLQANMCMIGIESEKFPPFMTELMTELAGVEGYKASMDFCPELFEKLDVDRVPAYAISVCDREGLHPEECKVKYIVRGDITLKYMLEKLSEKNNYFEEFYNAL